MKARHALTTILISAVAGAAAGILFAPDKGSKTRRELSKRGEDLADLARDEFEDFMAYTRNAYEDTRSQADDLLKKGETTAKKLKNKAKK